MMRFKLVAGFHEQNDAEGRPHVYKPGDIIETDQDLCGRFNQPGLSPKFEAVVDRARKDRFDDLSTGELKDEIAARELDPGEDHSRENLLKVLRA